VELAASYGMPDDSAEEGSTTVTNISGGGFCISNKEKLNIGQEIQLSVELSDKETVKILVRVAWIKKIGDTEEYRTGVQVVDSQGPDFEKFLEFYCEEVKKLQEEL